MPVLDGLIGRGIRVFENQEDETMKYFLLLMFPMITFADDLKCSSVSGEIVKVIEVNGRPYVKLPQSIAEFRQGEFTCAVFGKGQTENERYADYGCQSKGGQQLSLRLQEQFKTPKITLSLYRKPEEAEMTKPLTPFLEMICTVL